MEPFARSAFRDCLSSNRKTDATIRAPNAPSTQRSWVISVTVWVRSFSSKANVLSALQMLTNPFKTTFRFVLSALSIVWLAHRGTPAADARMGSSSMQRTIDAKPVQPT